MITGARCAMLCCAVWRADGVCLAVDACPCASTRARHGACPVRVSHTRRCSWSAPVLICARRCYQGTHLCCPACIVLCNWIRALHSCAESACMCARELLHYARELLHCAQLQQTEPGCPCPAAAHDTGAAPERMRLRSADQPAQSAAATASCPACRTCGRAIMRIRSHDH